MEFEAAEGLRAKESKAQEDAHMLDISRLEARKANQAAEDKRKAAAALQMRTPISARKQLISQQLKASQQPSNQQMVQPAAPEAHKRQSTEVAHNYSVDSGSDFDATCNSSADLNQRRSESTHPTEPTASTASENKLYRESVLRSVYAHIDPDSTGSVGEKELSALLQARRKRSRKGEWTRTMNTNLMSKMGVHPHAKIPVVKFVKYFHQTLPFDRVQFDTVIQQFLQCPGAPERQSKLQSTISRSAMTVPAQGYHQRKTTSRHVEPSPNRYSKQGEVARRSEHRQDTPMRH